MTGIITSSSGPSGSRGRPGADASSPGRHLLKARPNHHPQAEHHGSRAGALRVALFAYTFPSLSETFVINHIASLMDRQHDVQIISRMPEESTVEHAEVARHGMLQRTTYLDPDPDPRHQDPSGGVLTRALGTRGRRWGRRLRKAARATGLVVRRGWRKPGTMLRALNVVEHGRPALSLRLLGEGLACPDEPFDIIHCHFGPVGDWAARLRQIGALQGRLVVTFHGYDMTRHLKERGEDAYQYLFTHGDLFLPISERWRERLIELGCPPERTVVHHMGIDIARFTYRDPRPHKGPIKLLTVARLVEKKGVAYAIRAVATLLKAGYQLEYTIIGDGPRRDSLARLIDELEVGEHVRLAGPQTQEQIADHLQGADVFMAPSVTAASGDQEGVPVAIMEAMATGLPVVSTWHSGIPELVEDGVTGLLAPERDVDALADRLKQLADHPDRWCELSRAGRAKVEAEFDLRKLDDRLEALYRSHLVDG